MTKKKPTMEAEEKRKLLTNVDIDYAFNDKEHTITVLVDDVEFGPAPSFNAFKTLAPEILEAFPKMFASVSAVENVLMVLHFVFLQKGANHKGTVYPH